MLGDKYRVATHRRLLAIIENDGGSKAFGDETLGVGERLRQPFAVQISEIFAAQVKAAAKARFGQCGKEFIQISHAVNYR